MTIKLRTVIKHPAQVVGGTGIDVTKENGTYSYGLDLASLSTIETISDGDAIYVPIVTPGEPDVHERITVNKLFSESDAVLETRQVVSGAGLTGGGDLSVDRTLAVGAGAGITVNADDVALDVSSARNTDHAGVTLTAGAGLTGGGDISTSRSFAVGAGAGIAVNADDVALDTSSSRNTDHTAVTLTAGAGLTGGGDISASRSLAVGAGTGIAVNADDVALAAMAAYTIKGNATGSPATPTDIDIASLTAKASPAAGDYLLLSDQAAGGSLKKASVSSVSAAGSVASLNGQIGAIVLSLAPQGRLTLASGTPVMIASQAAKTRIYWSPYLGNMAPFYDGTNMVPKVVGEIFADTADTTKSPAAIGVNKVNDWFLWLDGSTPRLSHGPDWTNDTTRSAGTALTLVSGVYLNNMSITNGPAAQRGTYVGTTRSDGSSQLNYIFGAAAAGGTAGALHVWNAYNRVLTATTVTDSGSSAGSAYTTATTRQMRNSTGNQVSFVLGLSEDALSASLVVTAHTAAAANAQISIGLGFDSASAFANGGTNGVYYLANTAAVTYQTISDHQTWMPAIGVHTVSANEKGDGTNSNTFNDAAVNRLNVVLMN